MLAKIKTSQTNKKSKKGCKTNCRKSSATSKIFFCKTIASVSLVVFVTCPSPLMSVWSVLSSNMVSSILGLGVTSDATLGVTVVTLVVTLLVTSSVVTSAVLLLSSVVTLVLRMLLLPARMGAVTLVSVSCVTFVTVFEVTLVGVSNVTVFKLLVMVVGEVDEIASWRTDPSVTFVTSG